MFGGVLKGEVHFFGRFGRDVSIRGDGLGRLLRVRTRRLRSPAAISNPTMYGMGPVSRLLLGGVVGVLGLLGMFSVMGEPGLMFGIGLTLLSTNSTSAMLKASWVVEAERTVKLTFAKRFPWTMAERRGPIVTALFAPVTAHPTTTFWWLVPLSTMLKAGKA